MDEKDGSSQMVFGIYDYLTLGVMLSISIFIGLYSAFFKKDNSTEAYLFGNRKLKVLPVSASIMASEISSVTILSLPTEVYLYGSNMFYMVLSKIFGSVIIYFVVLPIYQNTRITTVYEYLERRFSRSVRTLCSAFFTLHTVLLMPVLMCMTSLSLSLVTGFSFYTVTIIAGAITTFYTAIGGIRAVVWADTIQAFFMFCGVIAIVVKGIMDIGSFTEVWSKNLESFRIAPPNFWPDLTERYSFWAWVIGGSSLLVHGSLNQGIAQRYLSVPNLSSARMCLVLSIFASIVCSAICLFIGMILVAKFADCDPLKNHKILARDQMVPLYIVQLLRNISGLPGLIIAAVVSATISTVSTQLNSVAAVVLNDYYKIFISNHVSDKASNIVLKLTVVILGIIVTLASFFMKNFGSAVQAYIIFNGAVGGLVLGTFTIGFFLPMIKSKPTFAGGIIGFAVMVWIATGMNLAVVSGRFRAKTIPLSVDGCEKNITITKWTQSNDDVFVLYRISSLWYTIIGMIVTVTVACLLSIFMERNDVRKMDRKLLTPLIHPWLPKKSIVSDTEISLLKDQNRLNC